MINTYKQSLLYVAILILFTTITSCGNKPDNYDRALTDTEKLHIQNLSPLSLSEGLQSLKQNCYTCHNPNSKSHDNMLAPPLVGIKYKYQNAYGNKSLFVRQMADFIHAPSKENALMKGPVRRFGLMPKTSLSLTEIEQLCLFIYEQDLEYPDWFPDHFEDKHDTSWPVNN